MNKLFLGAIVALGMTAPSQAAVLTLQGITANGPNDFTFNYQSTLGPDEGVRSGDRFIIYDFAGYIAGSIFAGPNFTTTVENTSTGGLVTPGRDDNPGIANLVFTYTGPDFRIAGGPNGSFDFPLIGARSTLGSTILDAFFALTTKNNGTSEAGTSIYTLGSISVPHAIPEPATWAMMIGGFGMVGAMTRRRQRSRVSA